MTRKHVAARFLTKILKLSAARALVWVLLASSGVLIGVLLVSQSTHIDELRADNAEQSAELRQADGRYDTLLDLYKRGYQQQKDQGITPTVPDPTSIPGKATSGGSSNGTTGPSGAAGADGRGIVAVQCAGSGLDVFYTDGSNVNAGQCVGPVGPSGKSVTGASGKPGADGQDGTPGDTGPQGPQGATGPKGDTGSQGATGSAGLTGLPGRDGISVTSITCATTTDGATVFRFALSDGTHQDVPGVCTPPIIDPTN